jgi:tetratricopeptide (TPR) repeat protein
VSLAALARYDEAIDQYRAAREQIPGNAKPRLNLALAFYKKRAFAAARDQLSALNQESPNDLRIAILLGDCNSRLGQPDKAISLLPRFETNNPDNLNLAWGLVERISEQERQNKTKAKVISPVLPSP